jgi:oligosaccharide repeat unit polymerase
MLFPIINLSNYGFNLFDLSSLKSLLEINNKIAVLRYSGKIEKTFFGQIILSLTYLLPFIGGFLYFHLKEKKIIFLSILPQLLIMLSQNTKNSFIAAVLIFISSSIACNIIFSNKISTFSFKKIILASLIGLLFYSLFLFSFAARRGELNAKVISQSKNKIGNYVAHLPAFDTYINSEKVINYSFGLKTFYGISNYFGVIERKDGVFIDFINFKSGGKKFKTNVYTVFRLLIEDFGVKGSIIFLSFLSFLFGFFRVNNIKFKSFSICLISTFIFFILYSFANSVFAYMSYIFSFFMFFLVLKIGSFKYKI